MFGSDSINEGVFTLFNAGALMQAFEYEGYRPEVLASKESAYIGTSLNVISPIVDIVGPDAVAFLESICVNSFKNFPVGRIRHGVMVNEKGQILGDGVILHVSEGVYRTYWLAPTISFRLSQTELDVQGIDQSHNEFFIQIAGPKSLEILEQATKSDLHDIRFAHMKESSVEGVDVRILRLGMAGTLAYEVHGDMTEIDKVYNAIIAAGEPFGAKKLGNQGYCMNHTEAGFPNINIHYPLPWFEDAEFAKWFEDKPYIGWENRVRELVGSLGDELELRFKTPYDVGWGHLVKFNHDFIGREALEKIAETNDRVVVTLEWNADDVADIYASQFRGRDVVPYDNINDRPVDVNFNPRRGWTYHSDWILNAAGEKIGTSVGRENSVYHQRMISLGFLHAKDAVEGSELTVLWGRPGTPQKNVRVRVAPSPYFNIGTDLIGNDVFDTETIPHPQFV